MLIIDKYSPTCIEDTYFNKTELNKLYKMSQDNAIPRIIFWSRRIRKKENNKFIFRNVIWGWHIQTQRYKIYGNW